MATSYEDSDVYKLAKQMAVEIHRMTLNELPKFEMYEQGSQIRCSSQSIVANFVEGYGRRHYKAEYIKFLTYSLASCDETKAHLELLNKTDSPFLSLVIITALSFEPMMWFKMGWENSKTIKQQNGPSL